MPSQQALRNLYVGQDVGNVPKPALVLDAAIIRRHCQTMIQTVKELGVGFRAHVKSHKTTEVAEMQVNDPNLDGNFIASTVLEIETLVPLLKKLKSEGRRVNVLYGIPLVPSQVTRLAKIALEVGKGSISVMIDHPDQLNFLPRFSAIAKSPVSVFLKVDSGYHRAGLPPAALNKQGLLEKLADFEKQGHARLFGVYSHSSLSYAGTTAQEAMTHLINEITCCREAVQHHLQYFPGKQLVISVGATPQALSSQHLLQNDHDGHAGPETRALRDLLRAPFSSDLDANITVELHAGVYPLLDMQQLSTNAGPNTRNPQDDIAISVLAEVCSVYNDGERSSPEALLAAGTLALGREPCLSYSGWAVVSPWRLSASDSLSRLIVERISQEHSIVSWEDTRVESSGIPLSVGQVVKLYPNHACVAASFYNLYFVVDSEQDSEAARIVDVWSQIAPLPINHLDNIDIKRSAGALWKTPLSSRILAAMFDTVPQALVLGVYLLIFACLVRFITLLSKRPFPVNAPKFAPGYPVVGALRFFFNRERFCYDSRTASPTGNYSYYLGRHRVVGLSGPQGRKTFFESRDLDLDQGVNLFVAFGSAVERASDRTTETHDSYLRTSLRTAFLRTESLAFMPAAIHACTSSTWNRIAAQSLIDPFREMAGLYAQSAMAVLGMDEVARSPELLSKVRGLVGALDGTFSAVDMVVPWLLNPLHIPVVIALGRLYVMMWRIVRHRKQQQQQKAGYFKKEGMLQQLIDKGRSTRAILKIVMVSQFVSQVISPTLSSWLLMGLATDAHWMARIRQEVDQVAAKYRKEKESTEQVLGTLDLHAWEQEFPLIEACLLETIRIRGVPLAFRKNISRADIPIGDTGEVIPPGAYATHYADEVHMDPDIYPDPQRWDPGRFLSDRAEHRKEPMGHVGFGMGRRTCPGQRLTLE
ncbi:hypothetical protein N8T08_009583 [Aspergillus melleus]|uniref:Uncharacterized protein n=1 Tax=Aspergillus melleus TaxID=138277 RepID=A0ACC3BD86_9EURO|nr:hypothetical protein N8T08_009583 [Aspergillus melleus]